jgi:pilus assembly protein CpaE
MSMVAKLLTKSAAPQPKPFAGYVADEDTLRLLKQAAGDAGIAEPHVVNAKVDDAIKRLQKMPTPTIVVIDLSASEDPIADLTRLSEVCDEGTRVLVLGNLNDVNLYRSLMAVGVEDYLVKPLTQEALTAALTRASKGPQTDGSGSKIGRVISVIGARGGVGATSVAVNTAWIIANEQRRRVALVDLDLFFGTCGLALDLDLGRGFREALENPSRIDGLFIERAMMRQGDNLYILSSEEALDYVIKFDPTAVELLIDHLRRDFEYVVVDLPRFAARSQTAMLSPPSTVLVVSDASLAGMRDTQRLLDLFKKIAPNADTSVVLSRVGENKASELAKADFEKGAQAQIDLVIPFEAKNYGSSAGSGKPLPKVDNRGKATGVLRDIARRVATTAPKKKQQPSWKRWIGGAS